MTTAKLRARVHRRFEVHPLGYDRDAQPWVARIYFNDAPDYKRTATAGSQPEAMLQAYKLMADLDAELMEQVHASRAARRAERCECIGTHYHRCPVHPDAHTMEATA